jgi:hypothetical protein
LKEPGPTPNGWPSFVGAGARELAPFWPLYVCALDNDDPDAYRACVCAQ